MMGTKIGSNNRIASSRLTRVFACAASAVLLLSGCGTTTVAFSKLPTTASPSTAQGNVFGGQQPIASATVQEYTVGTTGYGSAASPFGSAVTTNSNGVFDLPYPDCTVAGNSTDMFVVITGGMPTGAGSGITNNNLTLMVGLGPCSGVASISHLRINELTTIATVWSLSGFMTGPTNIGAPSTNTTGLANAFAAINEVVNIQTGVLSGPSLPSGATLPTNEINALGNILQNCANSAGGSASDSSDGHTTGTTCGKLFYLANPGTAPTDTVTAMLNIAQHPSLNLAYLNDLQSPTPAFSPALSVNSPPTDWTIAINYTGGGLNNPQNLAVDASGNVWVTNPTGNSVTELSSTGTAISPSGGYTAGGTLNAPYGIAIDQNGYPWVTNSGNNTITQLTLAGASKGTYGDSSLLDIPEGIAVDGADNIWVVNNGNNTLMSFSNPGVPLTTTPYSGGGLSSPASIAVNPK